MSKIIPPPIAFMSYVRFDDQHENGRLTEFRERLSGEIHMQTGKGFSIFQDRNDILWGQQWKERVVDSVDAATFLIPIITPSFFNSPACRDELKLFLAREKKLKRNDLILPVYYVGTPALDDEKNRAGDEMAQEIAKRQYADWRDLRFETFTSPQIGRMLAQLAVQVRDALERDAAPAKSSAKGAPVRKRARATKARAATARRSVGEESVPSSNATETGERMEGTQRPSAKTEPPTRVVDPMHRGNHLTITDAIAQAAPGDRILVRPGLYQEGLIVDKPLEIIGDGKPGEIVIQATGKQTLLFKTTMGRVANLTLRQMGGGKWFCVDIAQGRLELENCDITSQSLSCVGIHDGADPRLRGNCIHDGSQDGVIIYQNGQGTLEDNDIFGNTLAGIEIKDSNNFTLRRNRIHDGKSAGVLVHSNSQGTLEDNEIFRNNYSGIQIRTDGNPVLRRNRIYDNKQDGILVCESGQGLLEDNDISGNSYSGVEIRESGNPTLRNNRINKNSYRAIWVHKGGAGTIEDNDLRDNAKGALNISADSEPNVKRARNQEK